MKSGKNIFAIFAILLFTYTANAQNNVSDSLPSKNKNWEYEIKVGFNIGGFSPLPLPYEIRKIESYNPTLAVPIEANVTRWINTKQNWGITTGLKLENKAMTSKGVVKNYAMKVIGDNNQEISGNWTGKVQTKVRNTYLTVPILITHKFNQCWQIRGGMYLSYMTEGNFSGKVYDGYLREGNPIGNKMNLDYMYDFSKELQRFAYGIQAGVSYRIARSININADLSWGLNSIFKNSFETISFGMYPIYMAVGGGYVF